MAVRPSLLTQSTSFSIKEKSALIAFVEKIKNDQTIPLLNSSMKNHIIKPYGLTDTAINSS